MLKTYIQAGIAIALIISFVIYTQLDNIEILFQPQPIEKSSPCEIVDLTTNGYENEKLVMACLKSIA